MTPLVEGARVRRDPRTYDGLLGKPPDSWMQEVGTIARITETRIFGPATKLARVRWGTGQSQHETQIALDRLMPAEEGA